MSETSTFDLLIATFDDETLAAVAIGKLLNQFEARRTLVPAAATVVKDAGGTLAIEETSDIGGKEGAAAGALAGGLLGALSRKRGIFSSAAFGALLGGFAAHKLDTGIPDPHLEAIGETLEAASSAAVAVVDDSAASEVQALFEDLGAVVIIEPFDRDLDFVKQFQKGDVRAALNSLATHAESSVAYAGQKASSTARDLTGRN